MVKKRRTMFLMKKKRFPKSVLNSRLKVAIMELWFKKRRNLWLLTMMTNQLLLKETMLALK